ncbi:MAG: ExeM/NucH family extracellular endonuclease [Candidatus Viridilinea halotolerans]|uniref:ExeM/NucH family extracellular endonuclease n=1 Tax=Candidatus Viridilinea halotolerans TaxID=2491704 RepID=A0A426TS23_9CHLR|nr:MAG: ExeM/NucH family extracellular endonuclease [Candidatus Viridilinea halotolerans]
MVTVTGTPLGGGAVAPSITTEPASTSIIEGQTATLRVGASGTAPLSYEWYQGLTGDTSNLVSTGSASFTTPALTTTTSYWVRVSNSGGAADSATATLTVTLPSPACQDSFTPIYAIQGSGNNAAVTGAVTTQGVVVGDYEGASPTLRGFYIQDPQGDGDPTTSDGIFVFNGDNDDVNLGELVRVTGTAGEFQAQTQISSVSEILTCGVNQTVTPVDVSLPLPADVAGVPYLERFEGMLVRFPQQLSVTEFYQLGRFGQVVLSSGDRLAQPTNVARPGDAAQALQAANNLNRLILDDDLNNQNPDPIRFGRGGNPLSASNTLRGGDTTSNLVGVMTYGWGGSSSSPNNYRLRPINALGGGVPNFVAANPRPTSAPVVGGSLKIAAFNVLNYFVTLDRGSSTTDCGPASNKQRCRGAESAEELERQRNKLVQALLKLNADIVGLIELENTPDVSPEADIVTALNSALGGNVYAYVDAGVIGSDTIRVGFIYNRLKVAPVGNFALLTSAVNATFDDTRNRPALAQSFRELASGEVLTVVNNHFKSKGSGCGAGDDDTVNGQGNCNGTRTRAAQAMMSWLQSDPTGSGDTDILILGDLNAYAKEDPIAVIEEFGYVNLGTHFGGSQSYSYVFDGQWGSLDHALASPSLATQVVGAANYPINADEPSVLDFNTNFKSAGQVTSLFAADEFRTSDHDPVLVGLRLGAQTDPLLSVLATYDTGLGRDGAEILSVSGNRAVLSNSGDGSVDILDTSALPNLQRIQRIKRAELADLTSVAIHPSKDLFIAVTGKSDPRTGHALLFRVSDGELLAQFPVATDSASPNGRQPDSVEIAPDGRFAVIAIEAEQVSASDDGGNGALVVLDLQTFDPANPVAANIISSTIEFPDIAGVTGVSTGRTHGDASGAAITHAPGTIEPEGIAFAPDSQTVYVALQENNAIARLSLADPFPSTLPVANVFGLGQVTMMTDITDDDVYNPNELLTAYREPDGIRVIEIAGTHYLLTADEGDTRPNPRGGRTMSIFNATTGAFVADLGNQLAELAHQYGIYPDGRSDNGGVEPEMLDVISVNGRVIAAIGLERASALALVDLTDPTQPRAFGLVRTGLNPEGIKLVERSGQVYALSANEVSGNVTVATVPVNAPDVTLHYAMNTPRSFGIGAISNEASDALTLTLALSPTNAGMLGSAQPGLQSLGGGQYQLIGTPASLNALSASLIFTPTANAFGMATVNVSLSNGSATQATGTIHFSSGLVAPSITTPPQSQSIVVSQVVTLTVVATGTAPLSYQWYEGAAGDTSKPVGTDSASFTTAALTTTTSYWVRVSNTLGSVDSAIATITVHEAEPTTFTVFLPIVAR